MPRSLVSDGESVLGPSRLSTHRENEEKLFLHASSGPNLNRRGAAPPARHGEGNAEPTGADFDKEGERVSLAKSASKRSSVWVSGSGCRGGRARRRAAVSQSPGA